MIRDNFLEFSVAQDLTGGSAASTNVVDLLNARDIGPGDTLMIPVTVNTAFVGGTSLAVDYQGSVDNSTWTTYMSAPAVLLANLTAGAFITAMKISPRPAGVALPRYLRLNYTVAGTMTAGKVDAGIVIDAGPLGAVYPPGVVVVN